MAQLFGFEIVRKKEAEEKAILVARIARLEEQLKKE